LGENAVRRPAVRVVVIKGFLSRSRGDGAAVVGRDRPGWGESRALGVIELVNVHLPTVPNVGARSTTGNCGLSPMTPILFFHPFQILSSLRSRPSLRGSSAVSIPPRWWWRGVGDSPVPDWSFARVRGAATCLRARSCEIIRSRRSRNLPASAVSCGQARPCLSICSYSVF
jgi:hypothetical protein